MMANPRVGHDYRRSPLARDLTIAGILAACVVAATDRDIPDVLGYVAAAILAAWVALVLWASTFATRPPVPACIRCSRPINAHGRVCHDCKTAEKENH